MFKLDRNLIKDSKKLTFWISLQRFSFLNRKRTITKWQINPRWPSAPVFTFLFKYLTHSKTKVSIVTWWCLLQRSWRIATLVRRLRSRPKLILFGKLIWSFSYRLDLRNAVDCDKRCEHFKVVTVVVWMI